MVSEGSRSSLRPKPIHPDSESGLQWFPQNFVAGPGTPGPQPHFFP